MARRLLPGLVVALVVLVLAAAGGAQAQQAVSFASDGAESAVTLTGFYFAAPGVGRGPAVVLLHGCGGPYGKAGQLSSRYTDYAALFNRQGWHALVVDSLTPRGQRELCTQKIGTRSVTQANRRLDALAAVAWLAARTEVDARRIGLVGWSNGGSTVLAATNAAQRDVAQATVKPAFGVALYPGCEAELRRGHVAAAPLLLLVGDADDWTPPGPCAELAARAAKAGGAAVAIERYAGAYHGFDSKAPLRLRRDVPGGVHPGQGVHVGGDAAAAAASQARLLAFLAQQR
jgi:dienelactone hydrolase